MKTLSKSDLQQQFRKIDGRWIYKMISECVPSSYRGGYHSVYVYSRNSWDWELWVRFRLPREIRTTLEEFIRKENENT